MQTIMASANDFAYNEKWDKWSMAVEKMINILYVEDDSIAGRIGMSMIELVKDAKATLATYASTI